MSFPASPPSARARIAQRAIRSHRPAALVLFLVALALLPARGLAAVDCGCTDVGPYSDPAKPAKIVASPSGLSPHSKYSLAAVSLVGSIEITITRVSPAGPVLTMTVPNTSRWGFSPDDDRFVYHYVESGTIHHVILHDLTSLTPGTRIWEGSSTPVSSRVLFSPNGKYLLYTSTNGVPQTSIYLVDAPTGTVKYNVVRNFAPLPESGEDGFGTMGWGFSPDAEDRSFIYATVQGAQWVLFDLVNLSAGAVVLERTLLSISSFWQFSPCGDALAIVAQELLSNQFTSLYRTSDGVKITERTDPIASFPFTFDIVLSSSSASQIATVGGTAHVLAPNTAFPACPANPVLQSLQLVPRAVLGGASSTGIVTLGSPAGVGGEVVPITYTPSGHTTGPASVAIPQGAVGASFPVLTSTVLSLTKVRVIGTLAAITKADTLSIFPVPKLLSLAIAPDTVMFGDFATATVTLDGPPIDGSITVVLTPFGQVSIPASALIPVGSTTATFTVLATGNSLLFETATIQATLGSTVKTQPLVLRPKPAELGTFVGPGLVIGGVPGSVFDLALTYFAPVEGAVVTFTSDNPAVALIQPSVTLPMGQQSAQIPLTTFPVETLESVNLTASYRSLTLIQKLSVRPVALTAMRVTAHCVVGGDSLYAQVEIDGPAPSPLGQLIGMASDQAEVTPPPTFVIPAGADRALIGVGTSAVGVSTPAQLVASLHGLTVDAPLNVLDGTAITVRDLGTLVGFFDDDNPFAYYNHESGAVGLNNVGQVVGWSQAGVFGSTSGFKWSGGVMALVSFSGTDVVPSQGTAINDAGVVVGFGPGGVSVLNSGVVTVIPIAFGAALDINSAGHIVGGSGGGGDTAWIYNGSITRLGLLAGTTSSTAYALNDSDVVVGDADGQPFRWTAASGMLALPLPLGATSGAARDINNSGAIVGYCEIGGATRAIAWQDSILTRLENPTTWFLSVNNTGLTLGVRNGFPTVWNGGRAFNIASRLAVNCSVTNLELVSLNDAGQMVGRAQVGPLGDDVRHAVLLTSRPGTAWMQSLTPTLLSLVSAEAGPGRVRLAWFTEEGPGLTATVYRRTLSDAWHAVGQVSPDGTGHIEFEDTQVSAATRYGYRLGVAGSEAEQYLGETWVDVPRALEFALAGPRPNPAAQDFAVAFSLPDGSPARLELLDVAGRRIAVREVGALGPGDHVVNLAQGRTLAAGVYLLRLSRGGRLLTARAAIVR